MSQANVATRDPLVGTRIDGRYSVLAVLGHGGMGVVYEGVHDELGRAVAIKVLNTAWASDPTAVERFLREARTASSFTHGNIVDVSDLGRLVDGRPYLVMPKIAGTDLTALMQESGPQPAKRVAQLLTGVASALDLIHAKGFVHRDIKPENLMYVVREDGSETVMLLDFGIAALVLSNEPRLTHQGAVFGTPHYMPPEACSGALPDARGDVYALATVAFELITGRLPFDSENMMQVLSMKLAKDAPSLAQATNEVWPAALETVIACGLTRDPNQRYATASEFVASLRAATNDAPVSWHAGVIRNSMHSAEHALGTHRYTPDPPRAREPDPLPTYTEWQETRATAPRPYTLGAGLRERERTRQKPTVLVSERKGGGGTALLLLLVAAAAGALLWVFDPGGLLQQAAGVRRRGPAPAVSASSTTAENTAAPHEQPSVTQQPAAALKLDPLPGTANAPEAVLPGAAQEARELSTSAATEASDTPAAAATTTPLAAPESAPQTPADIARTSQPEAAPTAQVALGAGTPPTAASPTGSATKLTAHETTARSDAPAAAALRTAPRASVSEAAAPDLGEPPAPPGSPVLIVKQDAPVEQAEAAEPPEPELPHAKAEDLTRDATAALLRGEVTKAVELAVAATRVDPEHAAAWRTQGLSYERAGNARAAVNAYRRFLSLSPNGAQAEMVRERMQALDR